MPYLRTKLRALVCASLCVAGLAAFAAEPAADDPSALALALRSSDAHERQRAFGQIKQCVESDPADAARHLQRYWGKQLLNAKHYEEAAAWSLDCLVAMPHDTALVEDLLQVRITALLALGKNTEALQSAKSLFNVARTRQTGPALLLLAQCLEKAHPEDREVHERFRKQQIAGAVADGTPRRSAEMDAITIDPKPYAAALTANKPQGEASFNTLSGYANLLLLSDQPEDAMDVFKQMDNHWRFQVEAFARAMKAIDGTIGRGNQYLLGPDNLAEEQGGKP